MNSTRIVDRTAGWLGVAFLVLLLASEVALSLPDEHASPGAVAAFYAEHRAVIIILQLTGLVASALLALFVWRLRVVNKAIAASGLVLAITTFVPVLITVALALAADPQHPATADAYNRLEPRGDDA